MNENINKLEIGDVVSFTSKRFNYIDNDKIWVVNEKNDNFIRLEADDSYLIKLYPPRAKHTVLINFKYWNDVIIKSKQK